MTLYTPPDPVEITVKLPAGTARQLPIDARLVGFRRSPTARTWWQRLLHRRPAEHATTLVFERPCLQILELAAIAEGLQHARGHLVICGPGPWDPRSNGATIVNLTSTMMDGVAFYLIIAGDCMPPRPLMRAAERIFRCDGTGEDLARAMKVAGRFARFAYELGQQAARRPEPTP